MTKMIVAGVLGVVWRLFGACLEGVWRFEEGVCGVSGRWLEGIWGCLRDVWRLSLGCPTNTTNLGSVILVEIVNFCQNYQIWSEL